MEFKGGIGLNLCPQQITAPNSLTRQRGKNNAKLWIYFQKTQNCKERVKTKG